MKTFQFIAVLVLLPILVFAQNKITKEIETQPGGKLNLELTTGGDIEITGWDKNIVSIIAHIGGDKKDYYIDIDERSSEIKVEISYEGRSNRHNGVSVDIRVPKKYNLELETMGGEIILKDIEGSISGETMGGEIDLFHLKGEVDLTTMGGEIKVEDCDLDGKVSTMGGEISLLIRHGIREIWLDRQSD